MAGTLAACELRNRVRYAIASAEDEAGIRRLLRENPMAGAVSLTFQREPDYFRGANLAGGRDRTIVAYEKERPVCLGRATERDCWVDGQSRLVTYLGELRLDRLARRRFQIIRDGYRFFQEHHSGTPCFTSIASDNARARRILESGAGGLPAYEFLAELSTLLVELPRRPRSTRLRAVPVTASTLPRAMQWLNRHGQGHQLATVWTEERLRNLGSVGLPLSRMSIVLSGEEPIGCAALWDQRGFRQTVVQGYSGPLGVVHPLVSFCRRAVGRPVLPPPGSVLNQAFLCPWAPADQSSERLDELVEALVPLALRAGFDWLTLALPTSDPRIASIRRRWSTRVWSSRLYRVGVGGSVGSEWFGSKLPLLPDVALL